MAGGRLRAVVPKRCAIAKRPLHGLSAFASVSLIFLAAPIVLAAFWWWSMAKHDEWLTMFWCGVPLCFSIYTATTSWIDLRRSARGRKRKDVSRWRSNLFLSSLVLSASIPGWFATDGTLKGYAQIPIIPTEVLVSISPVLSTFDGQLNDTPESNTTIISSDNRAATLCLGSGLIAKT